MLLLLLLAEVAEPVLVVVAVTAPGACGSTQAAAAAGEQVRQAEALDLLIAMNSGMPAMATLHANSAREAVTKLCTLPLLAGSNIDAGFVVPTVAGSVDVVVHLVCDARGRRVREIATVSGRVEDGTVEMSTMFVEHEGELIRVDAGLPHVDAFLRAGVDIAALLDEGVP